MFALVLGIGAKFTSSNTANVYAATGNDNVFVDVYFRSEGYGIGETWGDIEYVKLREKTVANENFSANETYHNYIRITLADLVFSSNNPLIFRTSVTPATANTLGLTTNWKVMDNNNFNFSTNFTAQGKFSDTVEIKLRKSTLKLVEFKFEKTPDTNNAFIDLYTKITTGQNVTFSTNYGEKFFSGVETDNKPYKVMKKSASEIVIRTYYDAYGVEKFGHFDGIVINNEWQTVNNRWVIDGQFFGAWDTPTQMRLATTDEIQNPESQIQKLEIKIKKTGNADFDALHNALTIKQEVKVLGEVFDGLVVLPKITSITEDEIIFTADILKGQMEVTKNWTACSLALMNTETLDLYSVNAEARLNGLTDNGILASPLNIALAVIGGLVVLVLIGGVANYFTKKR